MKIINNQDKRGEMRFIWRQYPTSISQCQEAESLQEASFEEIILITKAHLQELKEIVKTCNKSDIFVPGKHYEENTTRFYGKDLHKTTKSAVQQFIRKGLIGEGGYRYYKQKEGRGKNEKPVNTNKEDNWSIERLLTLDRREARESLKIALKDDTIENIKQYATVLMDEIYKCEQQEENRIFMTKKEKILIKEAKKRCLEHTELINPNNIAGYTIADIPKKIEYMDSRRFESIKLIEKDGDVIMKVIPNTSISYSEITFKGKNSNPRNGDPDNFFGYEILSSSGVLIPRYPDTGRDIYWDPPEQNLGLADNITTEKINKVLKEKFSQDFVDMRSLETNILPKVLDMKIKEIQADESWKEDCILILQRYIRAAESVPKRPTKSQKMYQESVRMLQKLNGQNNKETEKYQDKKEQIRRKKEEKKKENLGEKIPLLYKNGDPMSNATDLQRLYKKDLGGNEIQLAFEYNALDFGDQLPLRGYFMVTYPKGKTPSVEEIVEGGKIDLKNFTTTQIETGFKSQEVKSIFASIYPTLIIPFTEEEIREKGLSKKEIEIGNEKYLQDYLKLLIFENYFMENIKGQEEKHLGIRDTLKQMKYINAFIGLYEQCPVPEYKAELDNTYKKCIKSLNKLDKWQAKDYEKKYKIIKRRR